MRFFWLSLLATGAVVGSLFSSPPAEARPSRRAAVRELGRRLFMDFTVSRGAKFSCAACHDPEHGFSDGRVLSEDENGPTARHSQTLIDLKDGVGMHWDGEFDRVRELLVARLGTANEALAQSVKLLRRHFASSPDPDEAEFNRQWNVLRPPYYGPGAPTVAPPAPLTLRLKDDGRYAEGFRRAFGSSAVTTERIVDAVEAYVFSIRSGTSAYDRYREGDEQALPPSARRGLALFEGKANCASCHAMKGRRPRFTDDEFRNTGLVFRGAVNLELNFDAFPVDGGRGRMSFVAQDLGKFKTPTLRDVAARAPYMHDGSLKTLEAVVRYYDGGGTKNAGLHPEMRKLGLTGGEVDDLVAFLNSLTSETRPGLGPRARHKPARTTILVEDLEGAPVEGLKVRAVPFGDRLGDEPHSRDAVEFATDEHGRGHFVFPDWTHVRLFADGYELGETLPLPDYTRQRRVIATPRDRVAVRVRVPRGAGRPPAKVVAEHRMRRIVTLLRGRKLGPWEWLYVSKGRVAFDTGRVPATLGLRLKGVSGSRRELDVSGGMSERLDLRPPPRGTTVGVTAPPGATPTQGQENGARTTVSQSRSHARRR